MFTRAATSLALALFLLVGTSPSAFAQEGGPAQLLGEASRFMDDGNYAEAETRVRLILGLGSSAAREDRAEAFRLLGLIAFFRQDDHTARSAFLDYLRLEPDAHLDPALVPPEAIALLEDVRARHAAELEALKPRPRSKRYALLNLVPVASQFQNGERNKGWMVAGGMVGLLAINLSSYYWLSQNCSSQDQTCVVNGKERSETARNLKTVNLLSAVGLGTIYLYSVIDSSLEYRRQRRLERLERRGWSLHVGASGDELAVGASLQF